MRLTILLTALALGIAALGVLPTASASCSLDGLGHCVVHKACHPATEIPSRYVRGSYAEVDDVVSLVDPQTDRDIKETTYTLEGCRVHAPYHLF